MVESEEGKGTEFKIYLPQVKEASAAETRVSAVKKIIKGNGETILVVEDNFGLKELAIRSLKHLGYQVVDGGDGSNVINIVNQHEGNIDLLLCDVVLPNNDNGIELARKLAAQTAGLKVLLMSGYADLTHISGGEEGVQFPLIDKPFRIEDLSRSLNEILNIK